MTVHAIHKMQRKVVEKGLKGSFRKFNFARKRKLVAKGAGGGGPEANSYFCHGPGDVDFKSSCTLKISC